MARPAVIEQETEVQPAAMNSDRPIDPFALAAGDLGELDEYLRRIGIAEGEELEALARQAGAIRDALAYARRKKAAHRPRKIVTPADRAKAIRVADACKAAIARGDGPKKIITRR